VRVGTCIASCAGLCAVDRLEGNFLSPGSVCLSV
jgi:hypothetical protein